MPRIARIADWLVLLASGAFVLWAALLGATRVTGASEELQYAVLLAALVLGPEVLLTLAAGVVLGGVACASPAARTRRHITVLVAGTVVLAALFVLSRLS